MARRAKEKQELPPPLPPERRTVGQLVAESIRLYGRHFWRALPLGLLVAVINQLTVGVDRVGVGLILVVSAPLFAIAYAYAARLVSGEQASLRSWLVAVLVGSLVFVPAAVLFPWFALASVLWLALIGLAVPAAMIEGGSFAGSARRGLALARVDYVHAAGSLATLVILFFLMRFGLGLLLESQADNTVRTAIFLADTVLAPLLFLGAALLYVDQDARLRSRGEGRRKEQDADLPHAHDADGEGGTDAAREPRPSP
jgi:VanZ family protein